MDFRLGFGPMSREVITAICNYTHDTKRPLMIIASRNQVDAETGYVMTTPELRALLNTLPTDYVWMCRDHCGPYFLDSEKGLSLKDAVEATKKTIAYDIEQGFNLIHIDTSRVDDTYGIAEELFKFCIDLNPDIRFEFGTEENVGVAAGAIKYKNDVAFAKDIPNLEFVVAQTGSLCHEDHQAGTFEIDTVRDLVRVANENSVKLKEHNADYLTAEQIQLRKAAGVHAMNIAPQLGVVQTKLLKQMALARGGEAQWTDFSKVVLASGRWKKWTDSDQDEQKVIVAGHYCFNSPEYQAILAQISQHGDWTNEVNQAMYQIFNTYTDNLA
jgi:D-tagatose-1,6-bisphosphate aldolase subunit GatZ/KbaZ